MPLRVGRLDGIRNDTYKCEHGDLVRTLMQGDDDKKQECWERVWNDCQRYRSVGREPATFMLDVAKTMGQPPATMFCVTSSAAGT